MAVSKKNRRRITVSGDVYVWFVRTDGENIDVSAHGTLHIISDDKKFVVSYPIQQTGTHNFIILQFLEIGDRTITRGSYQRVECPKWDTDETIRPSIVRDIILWCLQDREYVDVNHLGELEPEEPETEEPKTSHLKLVVSN